MVHEVCKRKFGTRVTRILHRSRLSRLGINNLSDVTFLCDVNAWPLAWFFAKTPSKPLDDTYEVVECPTFKCCPLNNKIWIQQSNSSLSNCRDCRKFTFNVARKGVNNFDSFHRFLSLLQLPCMFERCYFQCDNLNVIIIHRQCLKALSLPALVGDGNHFVQIEGNRNVS